MVAGHGSLKIFSGKVFPLCNDPLNPPIGSSPTKAPTFTPLRSLHLRLRPHVYATPNLNSSNRIVPNEGRQRRPKVFVDLQDTKPASAAKLARTAPSELGVAKQEPWKLAGGDFVSFVVMVPSCPLDMELIYLAWPRRCRLLSLFR